MLWRIAKRTDHVHLARCSAMKPGAQDQVKDQPRKGMTMKPAATNSAPTPYKFKMIT